MVTMRRPRNLRVSGTVQKGMKTAALFLATALLATSAFAGEPSAGAAAQKKSGEGQWLYEEIAAADAKMFSAFNRHELAPMIALFAKDVEFYHDKDGLISYADLEAGFGSLFSRND